MEQTGISTMSWRKAQADSVVLSYSEVGLIISTWIAHAMQHIVSEYISALVADPLDAILQYAYEEGGREFLRRWQGPRKNFILSASSWCDRQDYR